MKLNPEPGVTDHMLTALRYCGNCVKVSGLAYTHHGRTDLRIPGGASLNARVNPRVISFESMGAFCILAGSVR